jgi:hypothetical protein
MTDVARHLSAASALAFGHPLSDAARVRADSAREKSMKKSTDETDLRPEYDLSQLLKRGVRGKYAKRYHAGTNLVTLDPDVQKAFPTERAVNDALRLVIELRKVGRRSTRVH